MIKIELDLVNGPYGFEARDANEHIVKIDAAESMGGLGFGVRPMQLLLMGLGGCTGIDIISILKKQRIIVENFSIKMTGVREAGTEPSLWSKIHLEFLVKANVDSQKLKKACALSMEKYCSVAATLRPGGTVITWEAQLVN